MHNDQIIHYLLLNCDINIIWCVSHHVILLFYSFNNHLIYFRRIAQPVFLGWLVDYYSPGHNNINQNQAYMYAGAVVLCSALNVFVVHPYMMAILHMGMKFRVACCSLIYRKVSILLFKQNYFLHNLVTEQAYWSRGVKQ